MFRFFKKNDDELSVERSLNFNFYTGFKRENRMKQIVLLYFCSYKSCIFTACTSVSYIAILFLLSKDCSEKIGHFVSQSFGF